MEPIRLILPTVFEGMTVNSWLFPGPEPTLIDCGEKTDKAWKSLNNQLNINGLKIEDIKKVIVTHGHLDHMGMAAKVARESDAKIWVNEYLYDWAVDLKTMLDRRSNAIIKVMKPLLPEELQQKYFLFGYDMLSPMWDEIPADRIVKFPISGTIDIGEEEWDIIYTPGHCINQTCFYNPRNGYFLSADMLLRMIPIPIIDADLLPPYAPVKSLVMQLESYEKIKKLEITKTFPGHYESFDDAEVKIQKQVAKIQERKEKCHSLVESGIDNVHDLTKKIYPGRINQATLFMVVGFLDIIKAQQTNL